MERRYRDNYHDSFRRCSLRAMPPAASLFHLVLPLDFPETGSDDVKRHTLACHRCFPAQELWSDTTRFAGCRSCLANFHLYCPAARMRHLQPDYGLYVVDNLRGWHAKNISGCRNGIFRYKCASGFFPGRDAGDTEVSPI